MIGMWFSINPNVVAHSHGFFQTSMYVPYSMFGNGFRVPCGPPVPEDPSDPTNTRVTGNAYSYTLNAKDSSNLKSANYGTVYCPAFIPAP